jgi:hypothetical protein
MRPQRDYDGCFAAVAVIPVAVADGFYLALEEVYPLQESCMTALLPLIIL